MANCDLSRRLVLLSGAAALAAGLSACGQRGPLEPPAGSAQAKQAAEAAEAKDASAATGMSRGRRRPPPLDRPKRDFILDPLL